MGIGGGGRRVYREREKRARETREIVRKECLARVREGRWKIYK